MDTARDLVGSHSSMDSANPMLTEPEYATEWDFEVLSEYTSDDEHDDLIYVPYEISAGGQTEEGVFAFRDSDSESIMGAVTEVSVGRTPVDYVDVAGVTGDDLAFFPGVYNVFESESEFFDFPDSTTILTTEVINNPDHGIEHGVSPISIGYDLTEKGAETIELDAGTWLDNCLSPGECSTDADDISHYHLSEFSLDEHQEISIYNVETFAWEVTDLPSFEVSQSEEQVTLDSEELGKVAIEVTMAGGDSHVAECDLDLSEINVLVPEVDQVEFQVHYGMFVCG